MIWWRRSWYNMWVNGTNGKGYLPWRPQRRHSVHSMHAHCSPNHTLHAQFIYVYPVLHLFLLLQHAFSQTHPSVELACSMWFEQIDRVAWLTWIYNMQSISCNGGVAAKTNHYRKAPSFWNVAEILKTIVLVCVLGGGGGSSFTWTCEPQFKATHLPMCGLRSTSQRTKSGSVVQNLCKKLCASATKWNVITCSVWVTIYHAST